MVDSEQMMQRCTSAAYLKMCGVIFFLQTLVLKITAW